MHNKRYTQKLFQTPPLGGATSPVVEQANTHTTTQADKKREELFIAAQDEAIRENTETGTLFGKSFSRINDGQAFKDLFDKMDPNTPKGADFKKRMDNMFINSVGR